MRKLISLISLLAFLAPAAAQVKVRKAEELQRKTQAIDILKGVVENAGDIKETRLRVDISAGALDLLWKHDEDYARAHFIRSATALFDKFAADSTDQAERSEIRAAHGVLLKAFARHDAQAADKLLDKFQTVQGNGVSPAERLSVAQAGLDSDLAQSIALVTKILESGVPITMPAYLNELERRDPAAAASLCRRAVAILSTARVYPPMPTIVLSTYVFRETQMSLPIATGDSDGTPLKFGTFASPLSPPSRSLNSELAGAYLAAAGAYLNSEAFALERNTDPEASRVAACFFLTKKLHGYAVKLGMGQVQEWAVLEAKYLMLAERAKLTSEAVAGIAAVAQRVVTENTVFSFDAGESAFAAAEKTRDPAERTAKLALGIRQMIDDGKYAEAVAKIAEVQNERFQDQLHAYRFFRMAEAATRKLDWDDFNAYMNRVSEPQLRAYLILSAALSSTKKEKTTELLTAAISLIPKIEDFNAQAAVLITVTGILYSGVDVDWGAQVLSDSVKAINRSERYEGGVYRVTLEAPNYRELLPLHSSDLNRCFEEAAKRDWQGAISAAQGINSKALKSRAYIAASRNIL